MKLLERRAPNSPFIRGQALGVRALDSQFLHSAGDREPLPRIEEYLAKARILIGMSAVVSSAQLSRRVVMLRQNSPLSEPKPRIQAC
jgi:hypothetical protein